jgi:hypothetical protein
MKTKKPALFFTLMLTLFMALGANVYAGLDDPIGDPDLLDRPRVTLPTVSSSISTYNPRTVSSTLQLQSSQVSVLVLSPSGAFVPISTSTQSINSTVVYAGTVTTNNTSTVTPPRPVRP